ncbi:MAG: hypothetical protein ACKKL5_03785 [Candidatus Komeilibacteria bacterium]
MEKMPEENDNKVVEKFNASKHIDEDNHPVASRQPLSFDKDTPVVAVPGKKSLKTSAEIVAEKFGLQKKAEGKLKTAAEIALARAKKDYKPAVEVVAKPQSPVDKNWRAANEYLASKDFIDASPDRFLDVLDKDKEFLQQAKDLLRSGKAESTEQLRDLIAGRVSAVLSAEQVTLEGAALGVLANNIANRVVEILQNKVNQVAAEQAAGPWWKKIAKAMPAIGASMGTFMAANMGVNAVFGALGLTAISGIAGVVAPLAVVYILRGALKKSASNQTKIGKIARLLTRGSSQSDEEIAKENEKKTAEKKEKLLQDDSFMGELLHKEKLSSTMSQVTREQTSEELSQLKKNAQAIDQMAQDGTVDQDLLEQFTDQLSKEYFVGFYLDLKDNNPDLSEEEVRDMATMSAMIAMQQERNVLYAKQQQSILEKKPKLWQRLQQIGNIRSGNVDDWAKDQDKAGMRGAWLLGSLFGAGVSVALRSNDITRAGAMALSGAGLGGLSYEAFSARKQEKILQEVKRKLDDSEKRLFDVDFPEDPDEELLHNARIIESRLRLGIFAKDPILLERAQNFVFTVHKLDIKRHQAYNNILAKVQERQENLESVYQEEKKDIERHKLLLSTISVGTGAALGFLGGELINDDNDDTQSSTERSDTTEQSGSYSDRPDEAPVREDEMTSPQHTFNQDHGLLSAEDQAHGDNFEVKHSLNEDGSQRTEIAINIGKEGAYQHIDQALRRIVVDSLPKEILNDQDGFSAMDAARTENVLANLRGLITGQFDHVGKNISLPPGIISWDSDSGQLMIYNYDKLQEFINHASQGNDNAVGLWEHASQNINDKSDAIAYIDNTSQKTWQALVDAKLGQDQVVVADFAEDPMVQQAEQNVFATHYASKFEALGRPEWDPVNITEESSGDIKIGDTIFHIDHGHLTQIGDQKLDSPISVDDDLPNKLVALQLGGKYGLEWDDLRKLGVVESNNWQISADEKIWLENLNNSGLLKSEHFEEFKNNFSAQDFIGEDPLFSGGDEDLSFIAREYMSGNIMDKKEIVGLSLLRNDLNNYLSTNTSLADIHDLQSAGVNIEIDDQAQQGKGILFDIENMGADHQGALRISSQGQVSLVNSHNNLLGNSETFSYQDSNELLNSPQRLQQELLGLQSKEAVQNQLYSQLQQAADEKGIFKWVKIPMDKEYLDKGLDLPATSLHNEHSWQTALHQVGEKDNLPQFGQDNNFAKMYDLIKMKAAGGAEEKEWQNLWQQHPPQAGETVRQYLGRVVGEHQFTEAQTVTDNIVGETLTGQDHTALQQAGVPPEIVQELSAAKEVQLGTRVFADGHREEYAIWQDAKGHQQESIWQEQKTVERANIAESAHFARELSAEEVKINEVLVNKYPAVEGEGSEILQHPFYKAADGGLLREGLSGKYHMEGERLFLTIPEGRDEAGVYYADPGNSHWESVADDQAANEAREMLGNKAAAGTSKTIYESWQEQLDEVNMNIEQLKANGIDNDDDMHELVALQDKQSELAATTNKAKDTWQYYQQQIDKASQSSEPVVEKVEAAPTVAPAAAKTLEDVSPVNQPDTSAEEPAATTEAVPPESANIDSVENEETAPATYADILREQNRTEGEWAGLKHSTDDSRTAPLMELEYDKEFLTKYPVIEGGGSVAEHPFQQGANGLLTRQGMQGEYYMKGDKLFLTIPDGSAAGTYYAEPGDKEWRVFEGD